MLLHDLRSTDIYIRVRSSQARHSCTNQTALAQSVNQSVIITFPHDPPSYLSRRNLPHQPPPPDLELGGARRAPLARRVPLRARRAVEPRVRDADLVGRGGPVARVPEDLDLGLGLGLVFPSLSSVGRTVRPRRRRPVRRPALHVEGGRGRQRPRVPRRRRHVEPHAAGGRAAPEREVCCLPGVEAGCLP